MNIYIAKAENMTKLLDGLSSLDGADQERIIGIVNALDFAGQKAEKTAFVDFPAAKNDKGNSSAR